ncbi:MAG: hypothetical protein AAF636_28040 [Pseudomonadota bacterium]
MIWFVWPLLVDPINRKLAVRASSKSDTIREDLFRSLAQHTRPKHDLIRTGRG